jgi:hypothetical protein
MINIGKILKQSWHILRSYRVLWVFGFLLALTTGGGGSNSNFNFRSGGDKAPSAQTYNNPPQWARELMQWFELNVTPLFQHPEQHVTTFVLIGIALVLFILIVSVIVALVRYPSETAVMRMVDEYEQTSAKLGFRQGWRLGWSRRAFRMWLIDLILGLPVFLFVLLLVGIGLVIYFGVVNVVQPADIISIVAAIGFAFLGLFIFIVSVVFLGLLRNFIVRAAALEGLNVGESFRHGWAMFKGNWKSAGLMWLVMIGIRIAFGIASIILFFLFIPVYLILLLPAALAAFFPALIAFGVTSIFASSPLTWIIGALVALPFFFVVLFAPLVLIGGWYKIYESNVWTLTYREIKALASLSTPDSAPEQESLPAPM